MNSADQNPIAELPHGGENLDVMADAVNYNEFLRQLVRRYSEDASSVVDFGAGIGTFSGCLNLPADQVHCVEMEARSRAAIEKKGFRAYAGTSELSAAVVPYIFTLNVLEHIDDDAASLRELYRILEPGGRLFVYVPAFTSLFTSMDAHVGHLRRYRLPGLVSVVQDAGFVVEKGAYTDALGFFATLVFKLLDKPEPAPLNTRMLRFYDRWLFPLSRVLSLPLARVLGKNVFIVARKPAATE
jgi:SAM-dependent methyltransferase